MIVLCCIVYIVRKVLCVVFIIREFVSSTERNVIFELKIFFLLLWCIGIVCVVCLCVVCFFCVYFLFDILDMSVFICFTSFWRFFLNNTYRYAN